MKLSGWAAIESFRGVKIRSPDKRHVQDLIALHLLEKRIGARRCVEIESDALEAAESTFEEAVRFALDAGICAGTRLALARAGLAIAGKKINSRAARRARVASAVSARQRQLLLPLAAVDGLGRAGK